VTTEAVALAPTPVSRCFACGAANPHGLQLHFVPFEDGVAAGWRPDSHFEGFPGIIHGGIVATVLDEAMSKAVAAQGLSALTCDLSIRLRHSVRAGHLHHVRARVTHHHKRRIQTEAVLLDPLGREAARATAVFLTPAP
jgi:acyl-coenzyme A thioesterase PaaI-like protein